MQMPEHRAPRPPHSIASIIIWLSYSPPQLLADEVRGCHTLLGLLRRRHREGGPLQWPWDVQRCRRRASGRSYAFFRTVFYVPYAATSRHGLIHEDHTLLRCSFPPPAPSQRSASATKVLLVITASIAPKSSASAEETRRMTVGWRISGPPRTIIIHSQPPLSSQAPALALLDMAVRSLPPGLHTSRSTHLTLLTFGTRSDMQFRVLR